MKTAKKITIVALLTIGLTLLGITSALARDLPKVYPTLTQYEKATGQKIEKFNESPMLRTKVAAGELPPVEERLPEEPVVIEPVEKIGKYGGVLSSPVKEPTVMGRGSITEAIVAGNTGLIGLDPHIRWVPNIIKNWALSEDLTTLTVDLRKGLKWSDGYPLTAEDFIFWYENILQNDELTPVLPASCRPGGELLKLEKIDDYTLQYKFSAPYANVVGQFNQIHDTPYGGPPYPKHYLKKYHITYNTQADELARGKGFNSWWEYFENRCNFHKNPDLPTLHPYIFVKEDKFGNGYYRRNPYYYKIDPAGNQLPYIDEVKRELVESTEVINLKAIAGEFTLNAPNMRLKNYPLYKKNEEKGNYHVMLWPKAWGTELQLMLNYTVEDPVLRKIFRDLRFRQAISLAIDREEINKVVFFGKAKPRQAIIDKSCSFYEEWWAKYYIEHDVEKANELLDEIGLKWDKNHEYRLRPDGKVLTVTIEWCEAEGERKRPIELIKDHWKEIGINVNIKKESRSLYVERVHANKVQIGVWQLGGGTELSSRINRCSRYRPPWHTDGPAGVGVNDMWYEWLITDGKTGKEPTDIVKSLWDVCQEWLATPSGTKKYTELGKKIMEINTKYLFTIGTVGEAPWPVLIQNNLRNFPTDKEKVIFEYGYGTFSPYQPETWFLEGAESTP